jgi:hypothetical protein
LIYVDGAPRALAAISYSPPMPAALLSLITGLISGAITAVVTYYSTYAKARLDLTIEYDKELRKSRLEVYRELWILLKPLARYSAEQPLSREIATRTSEQMRDWYFSGAGMYLSRHSREPYFALKDALQHVIDDTGPLDPKLVTRVHHAGTALRAELSNDIGTRRQSFLGG